MAVHIAYVGPFHVQPNGTIVDKSSATIGQMQTASMELRVIADTTFAPNATDGMTIENYITAEDAVSFNLIHMDNTTIVTSDA